MFKFSLSALRNSWVKINLFRGKSKYILILIFVAGSLVRLADAFRPVDHASWRESDVAAVARNFATESMNSVLSAN